MSHMLKVMRCNFHVFVWALLFIGSACRQSAPAAGGFLPEKLVVPAETRQVADGVVVRLGGYGSSMAYRPSDSTFWLLTDRGPNVDGATPVSKVFVLPDYAPRVGVFRWSGDTLQTVRVITLKDELGNEFCGLPNVEGDGVTGEVAYDLDGRVIRSGRRGLDPEGLALMPDGSFWVSDEYGPYLVHFDADGRWMEERSPFNGGLPAAYARRRPNSGMEGLTANGEGTRLYGILQAPLVDDTTAFAMPTLPLWTCYLPDSTVREYRYPLDSPDNGVSELCCLNDTTLLVLERDGRFPVNGAGATKLVYRVVLPQAAPGEVPLLRKTLAVDILRVLPAYSHDKPEGLCMVNDSTLCVVNDDDFGVNCPDTPDGSVVPKCQPSGALDANVIYFLRFTSRP